MKKLFLTLFLFAISFNLSAENQFNRIVSLKPNITTILIDIGAKNKIVGITKYCVWKDNNIPLKVADYLGPKTEAVISLKPDLVLTSKENSIKAPIYNLEKAGINVQMFSFDTLFEISDSIKQISKITGFQKNGLEISKQIDLLINKKETENPKLTAIIVIGTKPLVTAGKGTYLNELLKTANFENTAPNRGKYPRLGVEELSIINPDVIIDLTPSKIPSYIIPKNTCYKKLDDNNFQPSSKVLIASKQLNEVYLDCREKK